MHTLQLNAPANLTISNIHCLQIVSELKTRGADKQIVAHNRLGVLKFYERVGMTEEVSKELDRQLEAGDTLSLEAFQDLM